MRERISEHRKNAVCAGCHAMMDPLGLALENFDGIGRWRLEDSGSRIDASGQLVDGTPIENVTVDLEASDAGNVKQRNGILG